MAKRAAIYVRVQRRNARLVVHSGVPSHQDQRRTDRLRLVVVSATPVAAAISALQKWGYWPPLPQKGPAVG
jgi:hypothetical protein